MTDEQFDHKMAELISKVAELPEDARQGIQPLVQETIDRHLELRKNCKAVHEAVLKWQGQMADLGLVIQYLVFDLEATKREKNDL